MHLKVSTYTPRFSTKSQFLLMTPQSSAKHRAFSLMEMLIVLGIIVVLTALLFPALQVVIERGRNAVCVGRLRAIGAGLLQYTTDNNGKLPYASMGGTPARYWFDALNPYMGIPETDFNRTEPYPWQLCPSKPFNKYPESNNRRQAVGYGWNHQQFGNARSGAVRVERLLSEVTIPSRTIIIADSLDIPDALSAIPPISQNRLLYSWIVNLLAKRHSDQGNYLMLDGHVMAFKGSDIVAPAPGTGATIPWWGIKQEY